MQLQLTTAFFLVFAQVPSDDLKEAVKHWEDWKIHYRDAHGSMVHRRIKSTSGGGGDALVPLRTEFATSGEMIRADQDLRPSLPGKSDGATAPPVSGAPQKAVCLNDKYGFVLTRDAPDSKWVIGGREWAPAPRLVNSARGEWTRYVWAPFTVMEVPLCELVQREQCRVDTLKDVQEGDKHLVELGFTYTPSIDELSSTNPSSFLRGGLLTLDPARRWSILRSRLNLQQADNPPVISTLSVEYDDTGGPFPRVRKVEAEGSADEMRTIAEVERLDFTALPRSQFTLTAYGLPEPDAVTPGSSRRVIYLIAIAVIAVVFAMAIRTIRRSRGARMPAGQ